MRKNSRKEKGATDLIDQIDFQTNIDINSIFEMLCPDSPIYYVSDRHPHRTFTEGKVVVVCARAENNWHYSLKYEHIREGINEFEEITNKPYNASTLTRAEAELIIGRAVKIKKRLIPS